MFSWQNILSAIGLVAGVIFGSWFLTIISGISLTLNLYLHYEEKKFKKEIEELEAEQERLKGRLKKIQDIKDRSEEYEEMIQSKTFYIGYLNGMIKLSTGEYIFFDKLIKENYSSFTSEFIENALNEYVVKMEELGKQIEPYVYYMFHLKEDYLMKIIKKNHRKEVVKRLINA